MPPAINTFQEAGLDQRILDNIKRSNYTTPTPIQKNAIPVLLKGRDLMGCAQTGSGKTAAFLLPMIDSMIKEPMDNEPGFPRAIIITPTRELTIQVGFCFRPLFPLENINLLFSSTQIYEEARKFTINTGIKVQRIYGGAASFHQAESLYNKCDILVATPGRLMDFVNRGYIEFSCVKYLVLDEADRMLDMGFITSIRDVVNNPTMTGKVREKSRRLLLLVCLQIFLLLFIFSNLQDQLQTLMFSATFPAEIQKLACEFLKNYIFLTIGILGGACTDVQQNFYELTRKEKRKKLTELLNEGDPQGTLVFVERKADADFLAVFMSNTTHSTTSIHGDRLQSQRELALREFKQGVRKVLIATSVAARGLDIPNVNHVINYDMPKSIDEYVHRIGRTGRVGNQGRASSFYDPMSDSAIAGDLVRILTQAGQPVPEFLGGGGGGYCDGNGFGGYDVRNTNGGGAAAGGSTDSYQQPAAAPVEDNWD